MTSAERVSAELEVLGLDASRHLVDFYAPMLAALQTTHARDLLRRRSQSELLVAGVKVATQTPPIRSGRRVVFLTLDDGTGPIDATFFDDAQGPYAATLFHSWLLLVRGVLRRTGPRGVSLRATGCWELSALHPAWLQGGAAAVLALLVEPEGWGDPPDLPPDPPRSAEPGGGPAETRAGGMGQRRVLVHPSGFRQSPYADVRPAGEAVKPGAPPRRLWHSSPGSAGG
jgi:error-prone DNA polymerase